MKKLKLLPIIVLVVFLLSCGTKNTYSVYDVRDKIRQVQIMKDYELQELNPPEGALRFKKSVVGISIENDMLIIYCDNINYDDFKCYCDFWDIPSECIILKPGPVIVPN